MVTGASKFLGFSSFLFLIKMVILEYTLTNQTQPYDTSFCWLVRFPII